MSAPDLAELRRLLAEARRPPPWKRDVGRIYQDPRTEYAYACQKDVAHAHHTTNAALIVAAVNALPYLLAKVEAAERLATKMATLSVWDEPQHALDEKVAAALSAYRKVGVE